MPHSIAIKSIKMFKLFFWITLFLVMLQGKDLDLYFLDVGEGEAIYINTPNNKNILVDSGNIITGSRVVSLLKDRGVEKIDISIITHPHLDHMSGIFKVIDFFETGMKYDNGENLDGADDLYRWYEEIYRQDSYKVLKKGDKLEIGDVVIRVLSPTDLKGDWNENSLALMVEYKSTKIFLTSDITRKIEKQLIESGVDLRADLLKVGHHGSQYASSEEFLKAVSPKFAVISINSNNIRGYPSKKRLDNLKNQGVNLYTTYEYGTLYFKSDGEVISSPLLK